MLTVERSHARELAAQRVTDPELLRLSVEAPYFPPDFPVLPFGPGRLAILCGGRREVLRSTIPLDLVKRVLGRCDGTRPVGEIAAGLAPDFGGTEEALRNVDELVTLLDRRGLLQDGAPQAEGGTALRDPETERFWEQVCAADSVHRSRASLRAAVDRFSVCVHGPAHLMAPAEAALRAAGLHLGAAGTQDVALVLYDEAGDLALPQEVLRPGGLVLFAGGGADCFRLGPLVPAERAATVAGWLAERFVGGALEAGGQGPRAPAFDGVRASLCAAKLFRLAGGIERGRKFNCIELFRREGPDGDLARNIVLVSPYLAADAGDGAPGEAMLVAAAQSGIEEPFSRHLSQRTYLMHYSSKNRKLAAGTAPAFFGAPALALPEDVPLETSVGTMAERLSLLCKWAFGEEDGRRITPSGGDLRSASLLVNLPRDSDLPAGLYRYRDTDHVLERLAGPLDPAATGVPDTGPAFLLVSRMRRVARKYQDAAYKICGLDVGVSSAVLMEIAARLGLGLCVRSDLDMRAIESRLPLPFIDDRHMLSLCLAPPQDEGRGAARAPATLAPPARPGDREALHEPRLPHWIAALGRAPLRTGEPAPDRQAAPAPAAQSSLGSLAQMQQVLLARRAVRMLPPVPLPPETILALLAEAQAGVARHAPDIARHLRIYAVDRARSLVADAADGGPRWRPGVGDTRIFWQAVPDMAPAMLVAGLEMEPLATGFGAPGYRYALQAVGAGLHLAWLGACARGLQGTLLGGVFNEGLNACSADERWRIAPIAGLVFGEGVVS